MRIYISGPTLGHESTHEAAFAAAAETLRKGGHEPANPATIQLGPEASWSDYMDAALPMLATCQGIYLLPGWSKSKGACIEHQLAVGLGLEVITAQIQEYEASHG